MEMRDILFCKVLSDVITSGGLSLSEEKIVMLSAFIKSDVPVVIYRDSGTLHLITDFIISMADGGLIIDPIEETKVYDFIHNDGSFRDVMEYEKFHDDVMKTSIGLKIPFNRLVFNSESEELPEYYEKFCKSKYKAISDIVGFFKPDTLPEKEMDPAERVLKEFLSDGDS